MLAVQAAAQEAADKAADPAVVGPPQLKDFSLEARERIVAQPPVEPAAEPVPPAPPTAPPQAERRPPEPEPARRATPLPAEPEFAAPPPPPELVSAPEPAVPSDPSVAEAAEPLPTEPSAEAAAPAEAPDAESGGVPGWLLALVAGLVALAAVALFRRRRPSRPRRAPRTAPAAPIATPVPAAVPVEPRAWLELELEAQRTQLTEEEATVDFELTIRNAGDAPARNVRIGARMFNAGAALDEEIGSYFRTGSEARKTFTVPAIPPGEQGIIRGSVALERAEVRPIAVQGRALFVPTVAVNAFYDWGENGTGQSARSYLIGRELAEPSEKMGPFRLDLGPRVWRTVGQRPHRMAKRV